MQGPPGWLGAGTKAILPGITLFLSLDMLDCKQVNLLFSQTQICVPSIWGSLRIWANIW